MKNYETPVIKVTEFIQDEKIMAVTPNSGVQPALTGNGITITFNS